MKENYWNWLQALLAVIALFYVGGELNKLLNVEKYSNSLDGCLVRKVYEAEITDRSFQPKTRLQRQANYLFVRERKIHRQLIGE